VSEGLATSATLAMNELAARLTSEGHELFRLGFGQSPFPAPDEVVAALRDNAHRCDYCRCVACRPCAKRSPLTMRGSMGPP